MTTRPPIDKTVRLGTIKIGDREANVFCRVQFKDENLSITGVEGPKRNGDCLGSCGQIVMSLKAENVNPAPGWTVDAIRQFLADWDEWHLNDMQAGSPAQRKHLAQFPADQYHKAGYDSHYTWACATLKAAGLQPDTALKYPNDPVNANGYHYGSRWLRKDVPPAVLERLRALPDTDIAPAWV